MDEPALYLIGGAPRVGKSTLMAMLTEQYPIPSASTDDLRTGLRQLTTPETNPDLFYLDSLNANEVDMAGQMLEDTYEIMAAAEAEARAVWPAVLEFATTQHQAGHNAIIEGVAILPELVTQLTLPYHAVFLGNQSPDHAEYIRAYAAAHPETWLGGLRPETIDAFAHFTRLTSHRIAEQAEAAGLPYVELGAGSFTGGLKYAGELLFPHTA